jgi:hypothetical protein
MRDSEILGRTTELECQLAFTELNIVISQPITPDSKYDYIADINNRLYRIQCKTSILSEDENSITFRCVTTGRGTNGNYSHKYSKEDIDFFYTYYNGISYLIPVEEVKSSTKILRFDAEIKLPNISWAKDYELKFYLKNKLNYEFDNAYLFEERKRKTEKELNHCIDCGAIISATALRCNVCDHKSQQKAKRPNRKELKDMIRQMSFTAIGEKYKVCDNTIRKWCKSMNLPSKRTNIVQISDSDWSKL